MNLDSHAPNCWGSSFEYTSSKYTFPHLIPGTSFIALQPMVLSELRQPLWGYITHFMREPGHSEDAWVSAVMHKRAPVQCAPRPPLHCGGWSSLWGKAYLCFLDLPEQAQPVQSDSSPLSPSWTMWPSAPCGALQQRVQLCLWAIVTALALWLCPVLTFWVSPLSLSSSLTFKEIAFLL